MIDWRLDKRIAEIRQNLKLLGGSTNLKNTYKTSLHSRKKILHHRIYPTATNRSKPNGALFYNRIPKCGSSSAMKIMRKISWIGAPSNRIFHWIDGPWNITFAPKKHQIMHLVNELYNINYSKWAYESHIHFINFDQFNIPWELQPNYINIMRDPIDQRISRIYYSFSQHLKMNNTDELDLVKCLLEDQRHCQFFPYMSQSCFLAGPVPACQLKSYQKPTKR